MKALVLIVAFASFQASAATAYLKLQCKAENPATVVDVLASVDDESYIGVTGKRNVTLETTSDNQDVKFVYTEGAKWGSVIVSASNGPQALHLVSDGPVGRKSVGKFRMGLEFAAKLTYRNWIEGEKVVEVTPVQCTGESFDDP